jgi:hypothetical protein
VYDLKGTVLKNSELVDTNVNIVSFEFDDSNNLTMDMHDNIIECRCLIIKNSCNKFINNILKKTIKLEVSAEFTGNKFECIFNASDFSDINPD